MKKSNYNLLSDSIFRSLMRLATPMIIAFSFQTSFNFVDRYFVSRLGDVSTAAIGMAFVVQLILIALGSGMGMGLNSFISRNLGAGRGERAVSAALHSFFLAIILGFIFSSLGFMVQKPLFSLLGAKGLLLDSIISYLSILFLFSPVYLLGMLSNNIFRGWGDTVNPMKFMMLGTFLNIILDPIFIFGWGFIPAMGIKGAALATGISRLLGLMYLLIILLGRKKPVALHLSNFRFDRKIVRGIFQVGFPASIGQILTSFSLSLIFLILKGFGDDSRAAYTIAFTYEMIAFLPVIGIGQAIAIMTGHNYGARLYSRIKTIYYTGLKLSLAMMLLVGLVISTEPALFASIFAQSDEVLHITRDALQIMAPGYLFSGIFLCTVSFFQGLGLGNYQLIATLLRMFVFVLPIAYAGSILVGLNGVWFGILAGNFLHALLMLLWFKWLYSKRLTENKIRTL